MQLQDVQEVVRGAVGNMLIMEASLFHSRAAERSASEFVVCAQLGWHLRSRLASSWDVDCENNRARLLDVRREADRSQDAADLIIHRRGGRGRSHNLLVMEVQVSGRSEGSSFGLVPLRSLMDEHDYAHGVLLDLHITHGDGEVQFAPRWTWCQPGSSSPDESEPVFDGGQLRLIQAMSDQEWGLCKQQLLDSPVSFSRGQPANGALT